MFRFTKEHLEELGITTGIHPGKRGFRVYPSWCMGLNTGAINTQRKQARAFQELG
ncbi:MAG: MepB family protein [Bifidobacterium sp.]|nr:MepB family protein [Bifidobacterium sp.]